VAVEVQATRKEADVMHVVQPKVAVAVEVQAGSPKFQDAMAEHDQLLEEISNPIVKNVVQYTALSHSRLRVPDGTEP
jgi:hypothetical protein